MRIKVPTITVGIPAFNEAANIGQLLADIKKQKIPNARLVSVMVSSDGSTDDTNKIVRKFKNVRIFANTDRKGLSRGLNQIVSHTTSDVLIIFNADIRLTDPYTISKLAAAVIHGYDLVSCPISDAPTSSYIAKTLSVSMQLKEILFRVCRTGKNPYTCHGPARAFSRKFYKQLFFPVSVGEDMYSYFACVDKKCRYGYETDTSVMYQLPETFADHKKQSLRYFGVKKLLADYFPPSLLASHLKISYFTAIKAAVYSLPIFLRSFDHVIHYVLIVSWMNLVSRFSSKPQQLWQISKSSKIFNAHHV